MLEAYVLPELEKMGAGRTAVKTRLIKTFGLPESGVAERLAGVERENVRLGYRAYYPEVPLRVTAYGQPRAAPSALRDRSNCTLMRVEPCELDDVSSVMPAISPSRRSSASSRLPTVGWLIFRRRAAAAKLPASATA